MQYAHGKGTLHRDIKPANLIIDKQNVVWVADFGLAKALEEEQGSHTGDIVGTLAYMAPEQLQGRADHRTDIYSLGLTLYELSTLRAAYSQTDRVQMLRQITSGTPPKPRQIRAGIPHDLETIVLKAAAHNPEMRYQSAGELTADLQCFLDDRPIAARRATAVERCWRWCRRNPVVAGLSAIALTLLILVAVVSSVGYARTATALSGERAERERAEAATDVAINVLDRVYERLAPPEIGSRSERELRAQAAAGEDKPVLSEGNAAVLEELLVFYDRLAESGQDDSLYREKVALANRRVGDIRHHLAQIEEAETAYQKALQLYRQIDQEAEAHPHAAKIASLQNELAMVKFRLGDDDQARKELEENIAFLKALVDNPNAEEQLKRQMERATEFLVWLDDPVSLPPGHRELGGPGRPPPIRDLLPPDFFDQPPPPPPRHDGPPPR